MAKVHAPRFLALVESIRPEVTEVTVEEVRARQERGEAFVLVDVREDHEWNAERAQGAVHLGRGILERDLEGRYPDPATELVLYCGGGFRSALAAVNLQRMGYTRVRSMRGGFSAWRDAGLPIYRGSSA